MGVGAESNTSIDKTQWSARGLLDKWWYCYHVSDVTSCLLATECLHVSSYARRCLKLFFGAFNRRAVVHSLRCVCVCTMSTVCPNLVYWDRFRGDFMVKYTHTPVFYWFYHFLNSIFIYEPYLPSRNIYGIPWWRSLEAETCRRWHKTSFWFTALVYGVDDDDDVFYIMLISAK